MSSQRQQRMTGESTMEASDEAMMNPAVLAAAASVGLSWYQFFVRGEKERGIFIGLWPPTFLAFASYFNQKRMEERMNSMLPGGLMKSVNRMMPNR
jgi:hypothetical protein